MSNLFISHSSRDNEAAAELQRRLAAKGHESVFLDFDPESGIRAGTSWERTLYTKLRSCRAVVALCSENYLASHWCFAEIALARMEGKDLFALQIEPWGDDTTLPSILTEDQYIDLRSEAEAGYRRLWSGFEAKGIVPELDRQLPPGKAPYPGLRAFEEADAPIFFGRDEEIRTGVELLNRIRRQGHPRLAMVLGSSGSGKSSLARAGIVPQLRRDGENWLPVGPFRPGRRPTLELARAFAEAFERLGKPRPVAGILARLDAEAMVDRGSGSDAVADDERPPVRAILRDALARLEAELTSADARVAESIDRLQEYLDAPTEPSAAADPAAAGPEANPVAALAGELGRDSGQSRARVLLVVDQFEELLGHDGEGDGHPANRFLRLLKKGIEEEDDGPLAIGTMRSDFLGMLQRSGPLRGVGFKSLSVGPISEEGMIEVIEGPAILGQIDLQKPELTHRLLRETGTADALPLLAFTLRAMWDRFHETRRFDVLGYESIGGLHGAIARVADDTLEAALATSEEGTLRDLRVAFLSLARPAAEGSGWARQPAAWEEMPERVRPMIQRFIEQRLLVKHGDGTVEVAHEALFRSWQTFGRWLDANAEGLHLRREIRTDAEKWDQGETPADKQEYLWRGGRLARALELKERGVLRLRDLETAFVDASESEEERLLAAEEARRQAELEQARALAEEQRRSAEKALALAEAQRKSARRMRNAALAVGAAFLTAVGLFLYAREQKKEAVEARITAEDQTRLAVAANWLQRDDPVRSALVLLELNRPQSLLPRAWPLIEEALAARLPRQELWGHTDLAMTAAFSPDGRQILTASRDGTARLWPSSGQGQPLILDRHRGPLTTAVFSFQGDRIATASEDHSVRLWTGDGAALETGDGGEVELEHEAGVWDVAFSHSGAWLATASQDHTARLWRLAGAAAPVGQPPLAHGDDEVNGVAFNRTDDRLATIAASVLRLWRIDPGGATLAHELPADAAAPGRAELLSVAFSPVDDRIVTSAIDGTVSVWTGEEVDAGAARYRRAVLPHPAAVRRAVFGRDGEQVFTACEDGVVRAWRQTGDTWTPEILLRGAVIPQWIELGPRGDRFVTAMVDGTVRIWPAGAIDNGGGPVRLAFDGYETNAFFTAAGDRVAVAVAVSDDDGGVEIWMRSAGDDAASAAAEARAEPIRLPADASGARGHEAVVLDTAFSPTGDRIVTSSEDKTARIWQLDPTGRPDGGEPVRLTHSATVNKAAFDPLGRRVVTASADRTARVWTLAGKPAERTGGGDLVLEHDGPVLTAAFSPSGDRIVTASKDRTARVWSADGSPLPLPDGGHGPFIELRHQDEVASAAFAPGGRRVVTASRDTNGWVWELDGSRPPIRLKGHYKAVITAAFDDSGRHIVTGAKDGSARIWRADGSGQPIVLGGHADWVVSAAFGPGGRRLVTSTWEDDARLWDLSWEFLATAVRAATSACLSPGFREQSLGEDPAIARRRFERCRECVGRPPAAGAEASATAFARYRECILSDEPRRQSPPADAGPDH